MSLVHQVKEIVTRASFRMRNGAGLLRRLTDMQTSHAALQTKYARWAEAEPLIEGFLALPASTVSSYSAQQQDLLDEVLRGLGYWFFYGTDRLGPRA